MAVVPAHLRVFMGAAISAHRVNALTTIEQSLQEQNLTGLSSWYTLFHVYRSMCRDHEFEVEVYLWIYIRWDGLCG